MSTALRVRPSYGLPGAPLLREGDRLSQPEFHRRYAASPPDVRAELINGVVYMGSPAHRRHAVVQPDVGYLLRHYALLTPGIELAAEFSTVLGPWTEVQPDLLLRVLPECGGNAATPDPEGMLVGAPELAVEVSDSTLQKDLSAKKTAYAKAGVLEYLVFDVAGRKLHAFDLPAGTAMKAPRGIWKSRAYPGLWIDAAALFAGNLMDALKTLERGVAYKSHANFVARLAARRAKWMPDAD